MEIKFYGVGILIESPLDRILVGKELRDKPQLGVEAGMWGNPWETRLFGESKKQARERLSEEEIQGVLEPGFKARHMGTYPVLGVALLDMYLTKVDTERLPSMSSYLWEVGDHRWVTLKETLGLWLRPGAREVFLDYLKRRCGFYRKSSPPKG